MSRYFKLSELTHSDTADRLGMSNVPNEEMTSHLLELMSVLDDLRSYVGCPIRVTSGYRCPLLNRRVGGSATSAHTIGYAADLQPVGLSFNVFKRMVLEWAKEAKFDQCIIERNSQTSWIHLGLYNCEGKQRHQVFSLNV